MPFVPILKSLASRMFLLRILLHLQIGFLYCIFDILHISVWAMFSLLLHPLFIETLFIVLVTVPCLCSFVLSFPQNVCLVSWHIRAYLCTFFILYMIAHVCAYWFNSYFCLCTFLYVSHVLSYVYALYYMYDHISVGFPRVCICFCSFLYVCLH